jgi:hypothetical protein
LYQSEKLLSKSLHGLRRPVQATADQLVQLP